MSESDSRNNSKPPVNDSLSGVEGLIGVILSSDKMTAYLNISPIEEGEKPVTLDDVIKVLGDAGVVYGFDEKKIREICENGGAIANVEVAHGKKAEKGKDTTFKTLYKKPGKKKEVDAESTIDYKETDYITVAYEGDPLLERIPFTEGKEGMNVLGEALPGIRGEDKPFPIGSNTEISPDNENLLIASISGEVVIAGGKVEVNHTKRIRKDVDFETGNIRFPGNVTIQGNVKSGFLVEADGNIDVHGIVEDATVKSKRDVFVKGFTGKGDGVIDAGGTVSVQYISNQTINAGENIIVNWEAIHSHLSAGKSIIVKGKKSALIGGECVAVDSIEVGNLGSVAGVFTVVKVGLDPVLAKLYEKIMKELETLIVTEDRVKKSLMTLYTLQLEMGKLPPEKQAILQKLHHVKDTIPTQIEALQEKKIKLAKELLVNENAQVVIHKKVYPKVKVEFGNQSLQTEEISGPTKFIYKDGEIVPLKLN